MNNPRFASAAFLIAGLVFLFAAIVTILRDGALNVAFFVLGIAFLVIRAATGAKARRDGGPPPAA